MISNKDGRPRLQMVLIVYHKLNAYCIFHRVFERSCDGPLAQPAITSSSKAYRRNHTVSRTENQADEGEDTSRVEAYEWHF